MSQDKPPNEKTEPKPKKLVSLHLKELLEEEELELSNEGAVCAIAYHRIRAKGTIPADMIAAAKTLRTQNPHVWQEVSRSNYMGLARAMDFCGLPKLDPDALQEECSRVRRELAKEAATTTARAPATPGA